MLLFRHDKFRKYQDKLINDVIIAIESNKQMLAHAPMGLGKTDAVLGPSLTVALEKGLNVFFLTPKISQHNIAIDVVKGINAKYGTSIRTCDIIGRRYTCLFSVISKLDHDNFYTACQSLRENEQCYYHRRAIGYNQKESMEAEELIKKVKIYYKEPSHKEIINFGIEHEACPYELMLKVSRDANIIIADYYHFFIPQIREVLLKKAKKNVEDSIIIVDEAHNLPARLMQYLSKTITSLMAKKAEQEQEQINADKISLVDTFKKLEEKKLLGKNESLLTKDELEKYLPDNIEELMHYFASVGEEYTKQTNKNSFCTKIASFLSLWQENDASVRIIKKTDRGISISKKCLDPSIITRISNKAFASIFMSGTLKPIEMYKDILGLENAVMKTYEDPFPKSNRLMLIAKGFTSKYEIRGNAMYEKYANAIDSLFNISPGGVAVFFPSFEFMEEVKARVKSYPILMQQKDAKPKDNAMLLELFRAEKSLLLAVQGGSFAEGIDFSEGEIKILVIAGLALDEMTLERKALIEHYDKKFGKGMAYAYIYPAIIKALQASGRAIRKESDKAAIIFMDDRFSSYKKMLPHDVLETANYLYYVKKFFMNQAG
ncbi:MAG: ATP-dependent DNA helicase [Candidatus Anstonellales archaeon]